MEVAISEISEKSHTGAGPTFRRAGSLAKSSLCGSPQGKKHPTFRRADTESRVLSVGCWKAKGGRRVYELVIGFELDLEKNDLDTRRCVQGPKMEASIGGPIPYGRAPPPYAGWISLHVRSFYLFLINI